MKKISFLIMVLALFAVACKKQLDQKPTDTIAPETFFNTEADLNKALNGVYSALNREQIYGAFLTFHDMWVTDELYYFTSGGPELAQLNYTAANSDITNFWRYCYSGIQRANLLLENIDKPVMNEDNRKVIKGETLFLRAYFYYLLVTRFGDVPLILDGKVDLDNLEVERTSSNTVYEQITKDMIEAEGLVRPISSYTYNSRVTKSAAQAILAKVYLSWASAPLNNTAKYNDVITWADKVIASNLHSLNPSYAKIFINLMQDIYESKEVIWEVENYVNTASQYGSGNGRFAALFSIQNSNAAFPATGVGFASIVAYNMYQANQGQDLRFAWNVSSLYYGTPGSINNNTTIESYYLYGTEPARRWMGKHRRKYELTPTKINNNTPANFPIIRYADVLLMRAEADNELNGPTATSIDYVNMVRRRGYGKLTASGTLKTTQVVRTVTITNGGTGYTTAPTITFSGGGATTQAQATATVSGGKITAVVFNVYDTDGYPRRGDGYTSEPTITISGGGGTGAVLTPVLSTIEEADATSLQTSSKENFRQLIRDERFREFAFESSRKQDLIRWNIYEQTMKAFALTLRTTSGFPSNLLGAATAADAINSRYNLYPIPTYEINLNPKLVQNPGW